MDAAPTAVEIFCSYTSSDEVWRQKLETHLSLLRRQGLVSLWHDRLIVPGTDWARAIDTHLETASVILLLVSADFFASDYCYGIEMKRSLVRHEAGEAWVIPLLVRPVDWKNAPFAHLHVLPPNGRPLSTWPDEDAVLTEVVAGIRRVLEDLPLTASATRVAKPPIWNIPYPRNPFFLGRDRALTEVHQRLQTGQQMALCQPQAISGLGGIGKTQLALEYAYRYRQDYQAVLWARAENTEALISSYVALAKVLHLPEQDAKEQEMIVRAVKMWLQTYDHWLLILDNADELALLPDFLPSPLNGHLILTTRAAAMGRLASRLEIETLSPAQGALLLLRRAALLAPCAALSQAPPEEREVALHISQALGGLPLALDQAGAYLEETSMNLRSYWHLYQRHRVDLLRERRGLVADHPESVTTTWSLSFKLVEEKNPAAADLLRLLALLAPDAIAEEILTEGAPHLGPVLAPVAADALLLNRAIEALRAYSLVQRNPKEQTLGVHRLVQAVLQDRLSEAERHVWAERAILAVHAVFGPVEPGTWSQCERLLPQTLMIAEVIKQQQIAGEQARQLLHEIASYLLDRARYAEAEQLFQQTLQLLEQQGKTEQPDGASVLYSLAYLSREQGNYARAEQLFQQTLAIRERHLGPEHPDVGFTLDALAYLYLEQGKALDAEPLFQRALLLARVHLEPEHSDMASPLTGLALTSSHQGNYAEAEDLFRQALQVFERPLEPEHPAVAHPLTGLANLYCEQGRYGEAEALFQRALRICTQALGPGHPVTAEIMYDLAQLREAQGNSDEACVWLRRALTVREQMLGEHHPKTIQTRHHLLMLLHNMGRHEDATQLASDLWE